MEQNWLKDLLLLMPFWALGFAVFVMCTLVDAFYVLWIRRSVEGRPIVAANYSALLSLFGLLSTYSIIEVNTIFFPVAVFGYWMGTYITIKLEIKEK